MDARYRAAFGLAAAAAILAAGAGLSRAGQGGSGFQGDSSITRSGVIRMGRITLPNQQAISLRDISTIAEVGGQLFGASAGRVVAFSETGQATRVFTTAVQRPVLAAHSANRLLLGDLAARTLYTMDTQSGAVLPLLRIAQVQDPGANLVPEGALLRTGQMMSVASNGKQVFVAVGAGFSSAVFRIDPATKQITARSWAGGPDPAAMTYHNGGVYVAVGNGRQVRKFTDSLQQSRDKLDLPVTQSRGLILRGEELRVVSPADGGILRLRVEPSLISRGSLAVRLDRVQASALPRMRLDLDRIRITLARKYAVLICGDLAENFWGECFWNDTFWMYQALRNAGYTDENIIVLYGDGADYMSANPRYRPSARVTDFAATPANVNLVLDGLKTGDAARGIPKMDSNDSLFLWTFDHGGGGDNAYLCLRGGTISDTDMAAKLDAIPYDKRVIFMQQCRSGGFIGNLANKKTFISTACTAAQNAYPANTENETYAGRPYSHGEYNYYIISALNKAVPDGGSVNADTNGNGKISAFEIHEWERTHEDLAETPQQNDMGGVGAAFNLR